MCGDPAEGHKILGKRLNQSQGKNPKKKKGITTTVCRCKKCRLVYSNPQPVPQSLQDHYGVPPEAYWKENYFEISDLYFSKEIKTLQTMQPFQQGLRTLDIGAGLGKQMISLSRAGYDSFGFEPSKPFYERALSVMKIPAEKLKFGMIEEMEYEKNHFDFISFGAVLEHLYDPAFCIEKALHWLKPGGIMHIEVPSADWTVNKLVNFYYRLRGSDYVANISPMHEPYHLYEFSLDSFKLHAQKNNYEVAFFEYHVCNTYMPKLIDMFLKPYMKRTNKGMQLALWLRKK